VQVGLGPGILSKDVEFMPGPRTFGNWLCHAGDSLVAKVNAPSVGVLLISMRAPGGETLAIELERLGAGEGENLLGSPGEGVLSEPPSEPDDPTNPALPIEVVAHIRNRGDVTFDHFGWAGLIGRGLWIEAFAVRPLDSLSPAQIEYKALTATGVETPWVGNGASCGTRGLGVPLMGFAVRLKQDANLLYECSYSGSFQSGAIIGPVGNGQPCRSTMPNDSLQGIRIRISRRLEPVKPVSIAPSVLQEPPASSQTRSPKSSRQKLGRAIPGKRKAPKSSRRR
jgi:hypothetical protein